MKILFTLISILLASNSTGSTSSTPFDNNTDHTATILILNKSRNTAWQLDAETGERIVEYKTGTAPHEVAVSPDQSRAVITNYGANSPGNSLTVLDLKDQKVSKTISLGEFQRPHGIEWFSDGKRVIVTAENQQAVLVIDIDSGEVLSSIKTNQQDSHMVDLAKNEEWAYVTNLSSGSLSIIDLNKGESSRTIPTGSGTEGVTYVATTNEVWITNRSANTVSVLNADNTEVVATLENSSFPIRAEVSADGKWVAVSNARSSDVTIFDVAERKAIQKISTVTGDQTGTPIGLTFSVDGSRLYVANSALNEIAVINTHNWTVTSRFSTGATPDGIAYIKSSR